MIKHHSPMVETMRDATHNNLLGILQDVAHDVDQQIIAWAACDDCSTHIRRYEKADARNNDDWMMFTDEDEVTYWFGSELSDEQRKAWGEWTAIAGTSTEINEAEITLEEAASAMGYQQVSPDWRK